MDEKMLQALTGEYRMNELRKTNDYTEKFGLSLTEDEVKSLALASTQTLKKEHRIELSGSVIPKLIYAFCDSPFIYQSIYAETMTRLQDIFFFYKNEMMDEITDDELIRFMKEQFDGVCYGDLDYLEGTCLDIFAQAIRAGYDGFHATDGEEEYDKFNPIPGWSRDVYLQTLTQLLGAE